MVNTGPSNGMLEKIGAKVSNKKSNKSDKKDKKNSMLMSMMTKNKK